MTDICTFRLDDITPDMDWNKFYRVKAIFDKYKIKPLIGVVPENADEHLKCGEYHADFWEYVASLHRDGWEIAQHGYQHIYETRNSGLLGLKKASEFAGLSYETQYEKLRLGREILQKHGIDVTIFMAPGHTYDRNTLKALKRLGFTCVTDGYANVPYRFRGLLFVPCRSARPKLSSGVDTICIHCNDLGENEYVQLERFLEKHVSSVVTFTEVISQLWYPKRLIGIFMQERCNLLLHRVKKATAENSRLQEYLRATYDENAAQKRKKRILGLPGLLLGKGYGSQKKEKKQR